MSIPKIFAVLATVLLSWFAAAARKGFVVVSSFVGVSFWGVSRANTSKALFGEFGTKIEAIVQSVGGVFVKAVNFWCKFIYMRTFVACSGNVIQPQVAAATAKGAEAISVRRLNNSDSLKAPMLPPNVYTPYAPFSTLAIAEQMYGILAVFMAATQMRPLSSA